MALATASRALAGRVVDDAPSWRCRSFLISGPGLPQPPGDPPQVPPPACPLGARLAATETFPTFAAACCASSSAWTLLDARKRTLLEVHGRIPAPPAPKHSAELDGLCCPDVLKLKSSALDDDEEDADGEEHESVSLLAPAPPARNTGHDGDGGQSDSEGAGVAAAWPPSLCPRRTGTANPWQRL